MHLSRLFFILATAFSISACATPSTIAPHGSSAEIAIEAAKQEDFAKKHAIKEWYKSSRRLQRVTYPILRKNLPLCEGKQAYDFGIRTWSQNDWPVKYREAAQDLYNLDNYINVYLTVGGSPADKAGMNRGDKILAVNDTGIEPGPKVIKEYNEAIKKMDGSTTKFTVKRGGKILSYSIKPHKICNFPVVYDVNDDSVNAYADGKYMYVSSGMMKFINSDNELALLVSHELGHNVMGHIEKKKQNMALGGALGFLLDVAVISAGGVSTNATSDFMQAGASAYSVGFEQEADYTGMYIMARSGYNITGSEKFWRRVATEVNARGISVRSTHPAHSERFISIQKASKEIQAKRKAGKVLLPNTKPKKETPSRSKKKAAYN